MTAKRLQMTHGLTRPEGEAEASRRSMTYEGMAYFAATGPAGATCRGCSNWLTEGWRADKGAMKGGLKDSPCAAFQKMKPTRRPPKVPHSAPACKYFEPREQEVRMTAPPIEAKF